MEDWMSCVYALVNDMQCFCIQDKTPCSIQDPFEVNAIVIHVLNIQHAALTLILTFNQLRQVLVSCTISLVLVRM